MAQRTTSRAAVALDTRAVRARGLALWVTRSDSELNARTTLTMWRTPLAWLQPVPVTGASPASRVLLSSNQSILCPSIFQYLQYSGLHLRGIQISAHRERFPFSATTTSAAKNSRQRKCVADLGYSQFIIHTPLHNHEILHKRYT